MKERLAGFVLLCALAPLAVVGYLIIVWFGSFGSTERARAGVRALDHFVNATVFNGYAWESVSSHAWRKRETHWWAKIVVRLTHQFQENHCMRSNKREQPIVNLVLEKKLHEPTIR